MSLNDKDLNLKFKYASLINPLYFSIREKNKEGLNNDERSLMMICQYIKLTPYLTRMTKTSGVKECLFLKADNINIAIYSNQSAS